MNIRFADNLPAAAIAERVNMALEEVSTLVVTADPGAGKSTLLPLTVLDGRSGSGKILLLEPRRIAARQIAERMAYMIDEPVGATVGYRIRFENRTGPSTRIEVLTEGILTRMLVDDPTLEGVDTIIFDEFHERSLNSDVALALARECQQIIRHDLKIMIMSATIDSEHICKELGAGLVECAGRMFPVGIRYADRDSSPEKAAEDTAHFIRTAHKEQDGDILAFLPGEADIRRCHSLLEGALGDTEVHPLFGMLSQKEQREAILPSPEGHRKVVLATPIAETSITIEGVRVVVDSGFCRKMVFNPQSGLSHLETVRISMDMARQRSGRAGRTSEGICYRLWTEGCERRMEENRTPEILEADLTPTVLDIAAWGENDCRRLPWLTVPPQQHILQASRTLSLIGAVDEHGSITVHGKRIAALPCHPRLSQMLLNAGNPDEKSLACDIAAILEEKDPLGRDACDCDLGARVDMLRKIRSSGGQGKQWGRIMKIAEQYRTLMRIREDNSPANPFSVGSLLGSAYPERVGQSRGNGKFLLSNGSMAYVDSSDILAAYDWIVAASLNSGQGESGRIFLGSPVDPSDLSCISYERDNVGWDSKEGRVTAQHETRIGCLMVTSRPISGNNEDLITDAICRAAVKDGLSMFDFNDRVQELQHRIAAVAEWHPELELPDMSTEAVLRRGSEWIPLYRGKASTSSELKKVDIAAVIWGLLDYEQQNAVDRIAPSRIKVPTGSMIRVEYRLGASAPVLKVRLQECFGMLDTPCVDGGKKPVLMELLSPGFKPVQLTQDLKSFWENTYFEVRKELKRRYPKHSWPDNPLEAEATGCVRKIRK